MPDLIDRVLTQPPGLVRGQETPLRLGRVFLGKDKGGTGTNEPMVWVIPFGKGRVFTTVLGHVMGDENVAIRCVGFKTVMLRGTEWANSADDALWRRTKLGLFLTAEQLARIAARFPSPVHAL